MSLLIESRPGRVFYNAEVTLRMVDQLLTDLGGEPVPVPAVSGDRSVADRVVYALMLVESLGTNSAPVDSHGGALHERIRLELKTLLRSLHEQTYRQENPPETGRDHGQHRLDHGREHPHRG